MPRHRSNHFQGIFQTFWDLFQTDQTDWVTARPQAQLKAWLALCGATSVLLAMTLYRWQAALFPLLGFFGVLGLTASTLGFAIGLGAGKRRAIRTAMVPLLLLAQLALFGTLYALGTHLEIKNPVAEIVIPALPTTNGAGAWSGVLAFVCAVFLLNLMIFRPLGQSTAAFLARVPPLAGVRAFLLGGVLGLTLFAGLGALWAPPEVWFAVALTALAVLVGAGGTSIAGVAGASLVFIALCRLDGHGPHGTVYSAYQPMRLEAAPSGDPLSVVSAGAVRERISDLSQEQSLRSPSAQLAALGIDLPFQLAATPEKVLILGDGG
ncbi:hypothetical protein K2X33_00230 [bacterium]|nr:hypothetical protein [bacterium]